MVCLFGTRKSKKILAEDRKGTFNEGPACATVRAGNVIGGGDWAADRIVPDCARAC